MPHVKSQIIDLLEEGDLDGAGELLLPYLDEHEDDGEAWTLAGTFFTLRGDAASAEDAFLLGIEKEPESFDNAAAAAGFYLQQERFDDARTAFTLALESAPPSVASDVRDIISELEGRSGDRGSDRRKLLIFVRPGGDHFIGDLAAGLKHAYDVHFCRTSDSFEMQQAMEDADICWFEWCDDLIVRASRLEAARTTPIVCRLHRYEVFTDMPAAVAWESVDRLMVVADHVKDLLLHTVPGIERRVEIDVVHNGVDVDRFAFRERQPGFRLAYAGYLHARKNAAMMLQIIARLVQVDARYELHVAGRFQDTLLQLYWEHFIRHNRLEDHVTFHGWQDNVAEWLDDKHYFLSTSIHESFGYAIAEAMTMGIKPVAHNFVFGDDVWPEEMLFNTVDEAVEMITSAEYHSDAYRSFVEEHYSRRRQVRETLRVLGSLPEEKPVTVDVGPFEAGALKSLVDGMARA